MHRRVFLPRLLLAFLLAACAGAPATPTGKQQATLYARLGGLEAIRAVVAEFLKNVAADDRINLRFATADIPNLRDKLVDQICQATGGPCVYKGQDMKTAHAGMNISGAEFDALVADLKKALDTFHVPDREQSELLGALGGLRGDIVTAGG